MSDWQRSFLSKLESAKKHWVHRFEKLATECLDPVFQDFSEFTEGNGFLTSAPECEPGTSIFKFSLTENGYTLLTFRMEGLDRVAFTAEYFVPGTSSPQPNHTEVHLSNAQEAWVRKVFEKTLDNFIVAFGEASEGCAAELVEA